MTDDKLAEHLRSLGWTVEKIQGQDGNSYTVIRNYQIPKGSLANNFCDVAIQCSTAVPYVAPAAIHTRPHLVPMDMGSNLRTKNSGIGSDWQYWSRVLRGQPSPQKWVSQIATIFSEV